MLVWREMARNQKSEKMCKLSTYLISIRAVDSGVASAVGIQSKSFSDYPRRFAKESDQ